MLGKINEFRYYRKMKKECYEQIGYVFDGTVPICVRSIVKNIIKNLKRDDEKAVRNYLALNDYIRFRKGHDITLPIAKEEIEKKFPFVPIDIKSLEKMEDLQLEISI